MKQYILTVIKHPDTILYVIDSKEACKWQALVKQEVRTIKKTKGKKK